MTRTLPLALASAVLLVVQASTAIAQMPASAPMQKAANPTPISEAIAAYKQTRTIILASVESMPAEDFSFKATPDIRTYAQMFTHVAQAQESICGLIAGTATATRPVESKAATKDEVRTVIKKSFDDCDAAYASVTDANMNEVSGTGYFRGTKLGNMWKNTAHNNEMYGQMVIYMRLKGIVPPSTAMRGRM
jgi:uncharacterized damage-inducible protein DinB